MRTKTFEELVLLNDNRTRYYEVDGTRFSIKNGISKPASPKISRLTYEDGVRKYDNRTRHVATPGTGVVVAIKNGVVVRDYKR